MLWVLVCNNMFRYESHHWFVYLNPAILEPVSIVSKWINVVLIDSYFDNKTTGNNSTTGVSLLTKMWKSNGKNILSFQFPRRPVGVKSNHVELMFPDCAITCNVSTPPAAGAAKTSYIEHILDTNVWSLYRRIFQQLNATSISDCTTMLIKWHRKRHESSSLRSPIPPKNSLCQRQILTPDGENY